MNDFPWHNQLNNRYCFCGSLEILTPLRVSSGRASDDTDAPLMRTFNGVPYIPGSSLRGALRSELERILPPPGQPNATPTPLNSCTLFAEEGPDIACEERFRNLMKEMGTPEQDDETRKKKTKDFFEKELCSVCRLFGGTMYASRLVIEDALPACGTAPDLARRLCIRDGVGIDRDTGAAREGVKFDYEVLEPGVAFTFRMTVENLDDLDKELVSLMLQLMKTGFQVGGKRASGLGRIKLVDPISVTGFSDAKELWKRLRTGADPHQPLAWEEVLPC